MRPSVVCSYLVKSMNYRAFKKKQNKSNMAVKHKKGSIIKKAKIPTGIYAHFVIFCFIVVCIRSSYIDVFTNAPGQNVVFLCWSQASLINMVE